MINSAFVNIWNKRVGAVSWNGDTGLAMFQYDKEFLKSGLELSPVIMPLSQGDRIYEFVENRNTVTFKGLPGLLADVLPDKYGNAIINAWLTSNARQANSLNPVETLCFIGQRGMGALEFEPVHPKPNNAATKFEIQSLIEIAEKILTGRNDFTTNVTAHEQEALSAILKIGSSAGGARAKALIAYNENTGEVRSGQANAPKGFTHWLIKFDGVTDSQFGSSKGYGRIEMAYHLMAKASGIEMTECRLLEEHGRAHFMTKRFDRENNKDKIHVQTYCALRHYDFNQLQLFSYEELFETMRILGLSYPQAQQLFRRMVFNVIAKNCDDHTKNFAFMMDKKGTWKLSPAYDVCHAYRPGSDWVSQHVLSINGKRKNITKEDLLIIARKMNIKNARDIISEVAAACGDWDKFAKEVNVDKNLRKSIKSTHASLN